MKRLFKLAMRRHSTSSPPPAAPPAPAPAAPPPDPDHAFPPPAAPLIDPTPRPTLPQPPQSPPSPQPRPRRRHLRLPHRAARSFSDAKNPNHHHQRNHHHHHISYPAHATDHIAPSDPVIAAAAVASNSHLSPNVDPDAFTMHTTSVHSNASGTTQGLVNPHPVAPVTSGPLPQAQVLYDPTEDAASNPSLLHQFPHDHDDMLDQDTDHNHSNDHDHHQLEPASSSLSTAIPTNNNHNINSSTTDQLHQQQHPQSPSSDGDVIRQTSFVRDYYREDTAHYSSMSAANLSSSTNFNLDTNKSSSGRHIRPRHNSFTPATYVNESDHPPIISPDTAHRLHNHHHQLQPPPSSSSGPAPNPTVSAPAPVGPPLRAPSRHAQRSLTDQFVGNSSQPIPYEPASLPSLVKQDYSAHAPQHQQQSRQQQQPQSEPHPEPQQEQKQLASTSVQDEQEVLTSPEASPLPTSPLLRSVHPQPLPMELEDDNNDNSGETVNSTVQGDTKNHKGGEQKVQQVQDSAGGTNGDLQGSSSGKKRSSLNKSKRHQSQSFSALQRHVSDPVTDLESVESISQSTSSLSFQRTTHHEDPGSTDVGASHHQARTSRRRSKTSLRDSQGGGVSGQSVHRSAQMFEQTHELKRRHSRDRQPPIRFDQRQHHLHHFQPYVQKHIPNSPAQIGSAATSAGPSPSAGATSSSQASALVQQRSLHSEQQPQQPQKEESYTSNSVIVVQQSQQQQQQQQQQYQQQSQQQQYPQHQSTEPKSQELLKRQQRHQQQPQQQQPVPTPQPHHEAKGHLQSHTQQQQQQIHHSYPRTHFQGHSQPNVSTYPSHRSYPQTLPNTQSEMRIPPQAHTIPNTEPFPTATLPPRQPAPVHQAINNSQSTHAPHTMPYPPHQHESYAHPTHHMMTPSFGAFHPPMQTVESSPFSSPGDSMLSHHASVEDRLYAAYSDALHNAARRDNGLRVIVTELSRCGGNALVIKNAAWVIYSLVAKDSATRDVLGHYGAIKILIDCLGARVPLSVDRLDTIDKVVRAVANLVRGSVHNVQLFEDADGPRKLGKAAACQPFGTHPVIAVNALKALSELKFNTLFTNDGDSTALGTDHRHSEQRLNDSNDQGAINNDGSMSANRSNAANMHEGEDRDIYGLQDSSSTSSSGSSSSATPVLKCSDPRTIARTLGYIFKAMELHNQEREVVECGLDAARTLLARLSPQNLSVPILEDCAQAASTAFRLHRNSSEIQWQALTILCDVDNACKSCGLYVNVALDISALFGTMRLIIEKAKHHATLPNEFRVTNALIGLVRRAVDVAASTSSRQPGFSKVAVEAGAVETLFDALPFFEHKPRNVENGGVEGGGGVAPTPRSRIREENDRKVVEQICSILLILNQSRDGNFRMNNVQTACAILSRIETFNSNSAVSNLSS